MEYWRGLSPALVRGFGLLAGILVLHFLSQRLNQPIDWQAAVLYGTVLGIAMRWPVIMPQTGVRVILIAGLLIEAVWRGGLLTGYTLILVEFGVRMLALHTAYRLWEWYRPLIILITLGAAWGLSELVKSPHAILWEGLRTDASAFTLAYGFWILLNLAWAILRAPVRQRPASLHFLYIIRQTWWTPLLFVLVGWIMTLVDSFPYPLTVPAALLLLWLQSVVGPVFTTLHQDRAVASLLRLAPWQAPHQRSQAHRVMRMGHALGQALHLSADELRSIGYASLLQDALVESEVSIPLWYPFPPGPEEVARLRRYNEAVVRRIEQDGVLQDVANLIRYRYAAYDGRGYPPVSGDAIPMAAQVLTAANALVYLTLPEGRGLSPEQAVEWIRTHAEARFQRELLNAMLSTLMEMGAGQANVEGLPQAIRQLQNLVGGSETNSVMRLGFRRVLMQLRGRTGLLPELPDEVQAVARLSTILAGSQSLDQAAQVLVRSVGQLMNAKTALALADDQSGDLNMRFRAVHDFRFVEVIGRQIAVQGGHMSRALLRQEPTQLVDLLEATSPLAQEIARVEGIHSVLFVPLVSQGKSIGLLMVGLTRHHWFTPREVGLIHLMSGLAATAMERARLMGELEERVKHISDLKAFTDTLLDNLSKAIIVVDPEGNLTLANAAAHDLFGLLDRRGAPLPPELQEVFPIRRALAGESTGDYDHPWRSLILSCQVDPLLDRSGTLLGVVCQARDVTQVRQMEERSNRLEKLAAIAELAAGAAHEIRNPLTSIRGFMQLLQAQGREGQAEYFQIMLNEIDRIDAIIRDLLLLARPARVKRIPTDLGAVVDEVLLLHQSQLERRSIAVDRLIEPGGPALLDPKMFRQLLLNLIINAVQAMPFGGRLTIVITRLDPETLVLQVADTGVGIAPENLKRLFDPFFTTKEEGTGLGLALCHSIVQAHGGNIEVESKLGVGTTFTVTLQAGMEQVAS
ncbi:MAG: ATP-binding protein [Bacillota bacterium]